MIAKKNCNDYLLETKYVKDRILVGINLLINSRLAEVQETDSTKTLDWIADNLQIKKDYLIEKLSSSKKLDLSFLIDVLDILDLKLDWRGLKNDSI